MDPGTDPSGRPLEMIISNRWKHILFGLTRQKGKDRSGHAL